MAAARSKTALVLTGGGIMGAAYEIGAVTALDHLFARGFSSRRFDIYLGISAGSVIAALLASRIPAEGLFSAVCSNRRSVFNWQRHDIYQPDWRVLFRTLGELPRKLLQVRRNYRQNRWVFNPRDLPHLLFEQFPAGVFSLEPMQRYLCRAFSAEGVCDDFAGLKSELYIPAYDLDRGTRVVFGSPEHRNLHICQAITASCAIPLFFRPYAIDGHSYVDGSSGLITHLDIAIERGARLIVLVNPRVPFDNDPERACLPVLSSGRCGSVADLGILFVWEQTQRIEAREKLRLDLGYYRQKHPDVDIVVIEPGSDEALLFFQGPMSSLARTQVMHHGYALTLAELRENYQRLADTFARHGIATTTTHLDAPPPEGDPLLEKSGPGMR
ncbi:MAG: patatin-like phospholipase family protein [Desulfuromonadales bacterium]|nr:patatin-like phospholipase family protein [Desulfuromonadales bacterium]